MPRIRSGKSLVVVAALAASVAASSAPGLAVGDTQQHFTVKSLSGGPDGKYGAPNEPAPQLALAERVVDHARNLKRLQAQGNPQVASAQSMDVDADGDGVRDVAVIVDDGTIVIPARDANPLDVQEGMRIRYTPRAANTYTVDLTSGQDLDPAIGGKLALSDDSFTEVPLTTTFPFLGTSYSSVFVGSDGHITLREGDGSSSSRTAARHVGGPPRLSALLTDLNPECGAGSAYADVRSDRIVVTWNRVVHYERGARVGCGSGVPTNTVQAVLFAEGTVEFVYGKLDAEFAGGNGEAVIGIAEGDAQGPLAEIDMTRDLPVEAEIGAIFEEYGPAAPETVDGIRLSKTFYATHPDHYDQLVIFSDFAVTAGGFAFHAPVQNQTLGLGRRTFDFSRAFGSGGELESFIWMNNVDLWAGTNANQYTNPPLHNFAIIGKPPYFSPAASPVESVGILDITGPGNKTGYAHHGRQLLSVTPNNFPGSRTGGLEYSLNSPVSVMFQEATHRWSAFTAFVHPTKGITIPDSFDLLGRDLAHWSTFFNTRVADSAFARADGMPRFSGMEGNALIELARDASGRIVDKNSPSRTLADPGGRMAAAVNSCAQQGKGMFLTEPDELVDGATELDQYLMGVRRAEEMSPFWYVDDPSSPLDGRSLDEPFPQDFIRGTALNLDDIGFCGTRVDLTVDNIVQLGQSLGLPAYGPRVPAIGDENDLGPREACLAENLGRLGPCADVKTMPWVLLVRSGPPNSEAHQPAIQRVNEFRKAWQQYVDGPGLGGRNADGAVRPPSDPAFIPKFDTRLEPPIH